MGRSKGIAARERTSPPADFGWRISGSDGLRSSCLCGSFALATVESIRLRDGGRSPPQRPLPYETTETPVVRQSQRDCVLQPRVAESARLPWVSVRADFQPQRLCPLSAIGPHPRWPTPPAFPRVARGSQPWAWGRNPFGILPAMVRQRVASQAQLKAMQVWATPAWSEEAVAFNLPARWTGGGRRWKRSRRGNRKNQPGPPLPSPRLQRRRGGSTRAPRRAARPIGTPKGCGRKAPVGAPCLSPRGSNPKSEG